MRGSSHTGAITAAAPQQTEPTNKLKMRENDTGSPKSSLLTLLCATRQSLEHGPSPPAGLSPPPEESNRSPLLHHSEGETLLRTLCEGNMTSSYPFLLIHSRSSSLQSSPPMCARRIQRKPCTSGTDSVLHPCIASRGASSFHSGGNTRPPLLIAKCTTPDFLPAPCHQGSSQPSSLLVKTTKNGFGSRPPIILRSRPEKREKYQNS